MSRGDSSSAAWDECARSRLRNERRFGGWARCRGQPRLVWVSSMRRSNTALSSSYLNPELCNSIKGK
jgi:hypothetical protein